MNFQEAEARFRWLEAQRAAGRMDEQAYRNEVYQLRVVDPGGRQWMLQERTGVWHIYDGRGWVPAMPYAAPAPAPAVYAQPAYAQPAGAQAQPQGSAFGKILVYCVICLVIWIVIGGALYVFVAKDQPEILYGVGLAALLSLVLMVASLVGSWQGQIVDLKTERVRVGNARMARYDNQTFAHIREPNGRMRKMRAMPGWQVGDRLEKRRGETSVRTLQ